MIAMNIPQAADETYEDVKQLIYKLAWQAARRHGGSVDDYVSAGNEGFMDAFHTYSAKAGTAFSTWVWWKIRGAITHEAHRKSFETHTGMDMTLVPDQSHFDYERFVESLGYDARIMVRMAVESPHEVYDLLHHEDIGEVLRGGLYRRLQAIGWSLARMSESLSEIREALQ